jgi:hypothetical protein
VAALQAEGFTVTTDGWCYGLLLKEDLTAHEKFQAAPEPGKLASQRRSGVPGGSAVNISSDVA